MAKLIEELKYQLCRLESLYQSYLEYKYNSKHARLKKDRQRATDNMFTYADMIEKILVNSPIAEIVVDGGQYQFEDFYKFVESDMPDYLEKIKKHIKSLETSEYNEDTPIE